MQLKNNFKNLLRLIPFTLILIIYFTSCVTYRNFPEEYVDKFPPDNKESKLNILNYRIENGTIFSGARELDNYIKTKTNFNEVVKEDEILQKGLFLNIKIEQIIPSTASLIFGYISLSTLTIIPVWSTKDGYNLYYDIYKDGERVKRFTYEIRRKAFVWIVMLPFVWVNLLTYDESEAFQATANKFFIDAKEYL